MLLILFNVRSQAGAGPGSELRGSVLNVVAYQIMDIKQHREISGLTVNISAHFVIYLGQQTLLHRMWNLLFF